MYIRPLLVREIRSNAGARSCVIGRDTVDRFVAGCSWWKRSEQISIDRCIQLSPFRRGRVAGVSRITFASVSLAVVHYE